MQSQVVPFLRCVKGSDWSRDELAQLYRIEHGLAQARLPLETDRGVTDEGDPWFVFCRGDGEVLVHICRVGNEYFLHSPVLPHPLIGKSFPTLTKSFVSQIPLYLPVFPVQGPQLFVHPASMLAVVVATIFYLADDVYFPGADGTSTSDEARAGATAEFKVGLQAAFQNHMDFFLSSLRDWVSAQKSAYLVLVSAVAAFVSEGHPSHAWAGIATDNDDANVVDAAIVDDLISVPSINDAFVEPGDEAVISASPLDDLSGTQVLVSYDGETQLPHLYLAVPTAELLHLELSARILGGEGAELQTAELKGLNAESKSFTFTYWASYFDQPTDASANIGRSQGKADFSDSAHADTRVDATSSKAEQSSASISELKEAIGNAVPFDDHGGVNEKGTNPLDALKIDPSSVLVYSTKYDLSTLVEDKSTELAGETLGTIITSATLVKDRDDLAVTGFDAGDSASALIANDEGIAAVENDDSDKLPLYDAAAVEVVNDFLKANPKAEIIFDEHGNVLVCDAEIKGDGLGVDDTSDFAVVNIWESAYGFTIALVGYVDHDLPARS